MTRLAREARARFARQVSLPEIGEQGQLRLSQTHVRTASPVTALYLERAGLLVSAAAHREVPSFEVGADEPALREAAEYLNGALSAVEAIKSALEIGTPLQLPEGFRLDQEHSS